MTELQDTDESSLSWGKVRTGIPYVSRRTVWRTVLVLSGMLALVSAAVFTMRPMAKTEDAGTDPQTAPSAVVSPQRLEAGVVQGGTLELSAYGNPVSVSVITPSSPVLVSRLRLSGTTLRFDGVAVGVYELVVVFSSGATVEILATVG